MPGGRGIPGAPGQIIEGEPDSIPDYPSLIVITFLVPGTPGPPGQPGPMGQPGQPGRFEESILRSI